MKKLYDNRKSVANNNVVATEKRGLGSTLISKHRTKLSPEVKRRSRRLSIMEVVG